MGSLVIVAEDDPLSREILVSAVERADCMALQCSNGKRAWETLIDNPHASLLITDIMMPEMDGRELVQVIRGHNQFATLPVIIVSAVVGLKEIRGILDLGASRFFPKPVDGLELTEYIQRVVREGAI